MHSHLVVRAQVGGAVADLASTKLNVDAKLVGAQEQLQSIAGPAHKQIAELRNQTRDGLGATVASSKDFVSMFTAKESWWLIYSFFGSVFFSFLAGLVAVLVSCTDNKLAFSLHATRARTHARTHHALCHAAIRTSRGFY